MYSWKCSEGCYWAWRDVNSAELAVRAATWPHHWTGGWGDECDTAVTAITDGPTVWDKEEEKKHRAPSWFLASWRSCCYLSRKKVKPLEAAQSEREMPDAFCWCLLLFCQTQLCKFSASSRPKGSHCLPSFQVTFSVLCGNLCTTGTWIMRVI